jgi:hypothetical protein
MKWKLYAVEQIIAAIERHELGRSGGRYYSQALVYCRGHGLLMETATWWAGA